MHSANAIDEAAEENVTSTQARTGTSTLVFPTMATTTRPPGHPRNGTSPTLYDKSEYECYGTCNYQIVASCVCFST